MLPDEKIKCPATGFVQSCRSIVTREGCECPKFVSVRMQNPQTGEKVDRYGCVDSFLPMLLIENAQQSRQTGAAIESFRNEVVKSSEEAARERDKTLAAMGIPKLVGNPG